LDVVSRSFKSPNAASAWRDPQSGYDIGAKPRLVQAAIRMGMGARHWPGVSGTICTEQ
jgi:hypothetical protein